MENNNSTQALLDLSDQELMKLAFVPWQYSSISGGYSGQDEDGFPLQLASTSKEPAKRSELQSICWEKFQDSPHINTNVRAIMGRLAGQGFETTSDNIQIQKAIEETELDWRNRLYNFWPKFVGRSYIEGELFLELTIHKDGFVEVDFISPELIDGGENGDGIIFHPKKDTLPLAYLINRNGNGDGTEEVEILPSIFCAYDPKLLPLAAADRNFKMGKVPKKRAKAYRSLGGCYKFVTTWDKSLITHRNTSHLRTVLAWLNNYETLKKYEIDHKRSAGAYLWVITMEDPKAFRLWLGLSDEDKRKTGIGAKKTPGGMLVLPPGMKLTAVTPNLPKISDSDTDILHMVTSGLNEPEDVSTGEARGTFASVKASRGPMSDRISDESAYFARFLRFDFWRPIFFLKQVAVGFPKTFTVEVAVDFKDQEPVFRKVQVSPEMAIEISFPATENVDYESRARGFLGVKHGSTFDVLGVPNRVIAEKLGLGNFRRLRLEHETEKKRYPELISNVEQEGFQERNVTEPKVRPKQQPAKKDKGKNNDVKK